MAAEHLAAAPATADAASNWIDAERRLVVIQRNPTSGTGRGAKQLLILIRELRNSGFRVRLFASRERLDTFVRNPQVKAGIRCLVAAGGDGTVGSIVNRHPEFPIATLPLGTENLLARHLKISRCGASVAKAIQQGRTRKFDVGEVNGQQFLLMLSVGVDSEVVRRLHSERTGNIRHTSYIKPILGSFWNYSFPRLSVYSKSGELLAVGTHVIATNIPEYGFRMPFSPAADPHDGKLDVRVLKINSRWLTLLHALKTRLGFKDAPREITRFAVEEIEIRSERTPTPSQCDGDPAPDCPLFATIRPNAMTLVVPPKLDSATS